MSEMIKHAVASVAEHARHLWDWWSVHPGATGTAAGGGAIALAITPVSDKCQTVFEHIWTGGPQWVLAAVAVAGFVYQAKKSRNAKKLSAVTGVTTMGSGGDGNPTPPGKV